MSDLDPTGGTAVAGTDQPWPEGPDGSQARWAGGAVAFPVPWTVFDAVGLVLWTLVAQLIVGVPLALVGFDATTPFGIGVALATVETVTIAGIFGWLAARGAVSWRVLGPVRPRWRHLAVGAGVGLAGFVIATLVPELVRNAIGLPPPPRQQVLEFVASGDAGIWLVVGTVVLVAPVVEEVVFRGLLFQVLRRRLGVSVAILLSSLTFAIVHLELITRPLSLAALFVLGAWLAAAFHRTGSLVVPISAHALFNGVAVAATLWTARAG